jgi:hypothetical protein
MFISGQGAGGSNKSGVRHDFYRFPLSAFRFFCIVVNKGSVKIGACITALD